MIFKDASGAHVFSLQTFIISEKVNVVSSMKLCFVCDECIKFVFV